VNVRVVEGAKEGVFVDVGVHVDKYAIPMAKIMGPEGLVIAVEPQGAIPSAFLSFIIVISS
jgi:hypothetical protein